MTESVLGVLALFKTAIPLSETPLPRTQEPVPVAFTLMTALPEARGVTVPVVVHPPSTIVKAPLAPTVKVKSLME